MNESQDINKINMIYLVRMGALKLLLLVRRVALANVETGSTREVDQPRLRVNCS
jgi:hypothetical protein